MGVVPHFLTAVAQPGFMSSGWWLVLAAIGAPAAVTGFFIRRLERRLERRDKDRATQEANREKLDLVLLTATTAAIALGEATAKAVQRIPDAHCNGDMHEALEYATKVKHQQKEFMTALGVHALHEQ